MGAPHGIQAERKSFGPCSTPGAAPRPKATCSACWVLRPDFQATKDLPLNEWAPHCKSRDRAPARRELQLRDKSYLRWTDSTDTMVVTFGEVAAGARTGPVKRQFWARRGNRWQIFFEGVIG